ncbi:MAG TPA: hypothetical protein VGN88_11340, partial [Phycisphaerae bacterium]
MSEVPGDLTSDKQLARQLATMIEAGLVGYKHYVPWVDEIINTRDDAPMWLLELSTIKLRPDAVAAIIRFVSSPPFHDFNGIDASMDHLACLF